MCLNGHGTDGEHCNAAPHGVLRSRPALSGIVQRIWNAGNAGAKSAADIERRPGGGGWIVQDKDDIDLTAGARNCRARIRDEAALRLR
jgi:hypothetical protein